MMNSHSVHVLRKAILTVPDGLVAGPSGLRVEFLRFYQKKTLTADDAMLEVLTAFVNIALSGGLPVDVRPYLCGGWSR